MSSNRPKRDPDELERLLAERDEEIRQLRLALDILSPIDPSSGMLNRIGVIDAIQDALNWLMRRNDRFAILMVQIPALADLYANQADDHRRLHQHLEATLAVALRRVDKVGHVDYMSFAAILREFKTVGSPDFLDRLNALLNSESDVQNGLLIEPSFTLAIIKPDPSHRAGMLLERLEAMRGKATPGEPLVVEM